MTLAGETWSKAKRQSRYNVDWVDAGDDDRGRHGGMARRRMRIDESAG